MITPGRKYSQGNSEYRFGVNKQEISTELNYNLFTAKYWEYDSRIGRRWNLDPIYNTDISRYAVNGNNPNYFLDPNGDFKSKFGAQWYKFWHGTKGDVQQNTNENSKRQNEWYIDQGSKIGKQGNNKEDLDEIVLYSGIYGSSRKNTNTSHTGIGDPWHQNGFPFGNSFDIDQTVDKAAHYINKNASDIWNSPIARAIVPDYYTLSGTFQTSSGVYINEELTFTLMLRGKDPGLYVNTTTGFGLVTAIGVDVGCNLGKGYYLGDSRKLSSSMLGGWQGSAGVGLGVSVGPSASLGASVDVGFDENGKPTILTGKVGITAGLDFPSLLKMPINIGVGKATNAIPIIKF